MQPYRRRSDWNSGGTHGRTYYKSPAVEARKHIFLHCNESNLVLKILHKHNKIWGGQSPAPNSGRGLVPRPPVIYAHECSHRKLKKYCVSISLGPVTVSDNFRGPETQFSHVSDTLTAAAVLSITSQSQHIPVPTPSPVVVQLARHEENGLEQDNCAKQLESHLLEERRSESYTIALSAD